MESGAGADPFTTKIAVFGLVGVVVFLIGVVGTITFLAPMETGDTSAPSATFTGSYHGADTKFVLKHSSGPEYTAENTDSLVVTVTDRETNDTITRTWVADSFTAATEYPVSPGDKISIRGAGITPGDKITVRWSGTVNGESYTKIIASGTVPESATTVTLD